MGNRAVISTEVEGVPKKYSPSIYLHWNGGRPSVEAFLKCAKILGIRLGDKQYSLARLCQVISNFLGGTLSIGVGVYANMDTDNGDNGVYWVKNGKIVKREFDGGHEQTMSDEEFNELVDYILEKNKSHFPVKFTGKEYQLKNEWEE